jgi:3-methylcrotonyl-CoA carboxylase alpha subunit
MPGVRVGRIPKAARCRYYDSLLAKLVVWGDTRETARLRAHEALAHYPILGIRTNVPLLMRLLMHDRFVAGDLDTHFLDTEAAARAARLAAHSRCARGGGHGASRRVRHHPPAADVIGSMDVARWTPCLTPRRPSRRSAPAAFCSAATDVSASPTPRRPRGHLGVPGRRGDVIGAAPSRVRATAADELASLAAPMPATVIAIAVQPGQKVAAGDVLIRLEAMKMELPVRSPRDATVIAVKCREGQLVQPGVPLLELGEA